MLTRRAQRPQSVPCHIAVFFARLPDTKPGFAWETQPRGGGGVTQRALIAGSINHLLATYGKPTVST